MEHLFDDGVTPGKFAKFVAPSVVMLIVTALYSVIDAIFVANMVGDKALASMSIVYPVQGLIWGISIMLAAGSSAVVAIKMGEGKDREANEKFTLIFIVSAILGVAVIVLCLSFLEQLVGFLGATPILWSYCIDYTEVLVLGAPAAFIGVLFEYFIRVDGRPGFTLFLYLSGGVVHVVLDYVFMGPMGMGIEGAAWATVAGMVTVMLIGGGYFIVCKTKLRFVKPKLDFRYVGNCMANGSSELVSESSVGITTFFFNMVVLRLTGEAGVAALNVVMNAHYLMISTHLGFIAGVAPLISYYYGAENYDKVKIFLRYSRNFIVVSSVGLAALCLVCAPLIAGIFERPGTEVYELALGGVRFLSGAFLFTGVNIFASGFFTAYGNGPISALISLSRALIMVLVGLFALSFLLGMDGVWLTLVFADMTTMGLSFYLFKKYQSRYQYGLKVS